MRKNEEIIQNVVCARLKKKYPNVLYRVDLGGIKLTQGQAVKNSKIQKCRAWPDIFIAEKRKNFGGFFLEIKKNRSSVYTLKNKLKKDKHILEQYLMLKLLEKQGFFCRFGLGEDNCNELIDFYLNLLK
ncbi:MAG TPA: hypothetical protein VMZ91_13310 [Candidatus Paceibacterota bacterium]|nr:hypothetical protein [Candidatus Paceibacterota bacterium]